MPMQLDPKTGTEVFVPSQSPVSTQGQRHMATSNPFQALNRTNSPRLTPIQGPGMPSDLAYMNHQDNMDAQAEGGFTPMTAPAKYGREGREKVLRSLPAPKEGQAYIVHDTYRETNVHLGSNIGMVHLNKFGVAVVPPSVARYCVDNFSDRFSASFEGTHVQTPLDVVSETPEEAELRAESDAYIGYEDQLSKLRGAQAQEDLMMQERSSLSQEEKVAEHIESLQRRLIDQEEVITALQEDSSKKDDTILSLTERLARSFTPPGKSVLDETTVEFLQEYHSESPRNEKMALLLKKMVPWAFPEETKASAPSKRKAPTKKTASKKK